MAEQQKRLSPIGIIVIVALIFLAIKFIPIGGENGIKEPNRLVCDVTVKNPLFQDVEIIAHSCYQEYALTCIFNINVARQSIWDEGYIKMIVGGQTVAQKGYKVEELDSKQYTLGACTKATSGQLRLVADGATKDMVNFEA